MALKTSQYTINVVVSPDGDLISGEIAIGGQVIKQLDPDELAEATVADIIGEYYLIEGEEPAAVELAQDLEDVLSVFDLAAMSTKSAREVIAPDDWQEDEEVEHGNG